MKTRTRTTHSLGILDKWGNCDKWGIRGTLSGLHSLRRVTLPRMLNISTVSKLAAAKTRRSHSNTIFESVGKRSACPSPLNRERAGVRAERPDSFGGETVRLGL